ncbi:dihydroorotase [Corynebacterium imitans]|uniref:dihydroorotase n=1 Tax=Corynebacterium imitans TaxID=156978 RepID=UPI001EF26B66|nr:dihydroorotase [Corynebacterium imitans]MCG7277507.1 dihydroorotase [Corynebacterium imitans]MDK8306805.1 dihydroorotase [Corynebacterium imitans]MDK8638215.1 dihydroorotase [Corynebacterium imitans]MDK8773294.1 dihydroorotase [Corynebacterium imitans]
MGKFVIKNVRPYGEDEVQLLIDGGVIQAIGKDLGLDETDESFEVIDAGGKVLLPGLVDMHVHLREPGREDTETIATGSDAAAKGGFTAVFTMANTSPVIDQPFLADAVWEKGQAYGKCDVYPVGAITQNLEGKQLSEIGLMSQGHVRMFSDDGKCVNDPQVMRRAVEYAKAYDVLLAQHAEDHRMTADAVAHEGETAARLGLGGWPRVAEESVVARDVIMTRDYGGRLHICHASTEGTVELLRWAKGQGINVSAEATPHHLLLTDEKLETYDGVYRVNPPLREQRDTIALRDALLDGTIDVVATDHAPHGSEDKCVEFEHAKPGMLGLETSLPIISQVFVESGLADWRFVAKVMSERPAEILRLADQGRPIAEGEPANLVLVDPGAAWTVEGDKLRSKASNTPYEGTEFATSIALTMLRGEVTYRADETETETTTTSTK